MSTAINVPIETRTHELAQLQRCIPTVAQHARTADLDDEADTLERIYDEHVEGVEATYPDGDEFAAHVSMPADDWRSVVSGLGRLDGGDIWWLRLKLSARLRDRMEEVQD